MVLSNDYAIVREECPICRQGRIFVAKTEEENGYFVICEDCEFEWDCPSDIDTIDPTRDTHPFERFVLVEDLKDHPWFSYVQNR
jgi:hypothetical protein